MDIGHRTVSALVERMQDHGADWCDSYGEPGYQREGTAGVILGYYWCKCDAVQERFDAGSSKWTRVGADDPTAPGDRRNYLHGLEHHYPRVFAALEEQGWQLEWSDEWWIDFETGKAWRTTEDSYSWQPSIVWDDDACDYLTPDHDVETWIDWAADDAHRCIPSRVWSSGDLSAAGFTQWEPENPQQYESGWHPGQTDNPEEITREIRREVGDARRVVFLLDSTGQFDIRFSAWVEDEEREEEEEE